MAAPGAGNTRTFTLRTNAADTTLTCTVSGTATACDSGAVTVPVAALARVSIKSASEGGPGNTDVLFGFACVVP
jgi:hypothetical protein